MVHLLPLPGAPGYAGSMQQILERAAADAQALARGGVDGIIIENYGDVPFYPETVPPETVSAMTRVVAYVRTIIDLPIGVNVLRPCTLQSPAPRLRRCAVRSHRRADR